MVAIANSIVDGFSLTKFFSIAKYLILIGIVSIMLYVPLLNKCFWIAAILIFFSGTWRQSWPVLLKDKIILTCLVLILLFTLGIFYSQGSWHYSLQVWDKYLKICCLLFFIPVFTQRSMRNKAIFLLVFGVMINEIITYLHYFNFIDFGFPPSKHWLFVQDIDSGYIVSYTAYLMANYSLDNVSSMNLSKRSSLFAVVPRLVRGIQDVLDPADKPRDDGSRDSLLRFVELTLDNKRFRWVGLLCIAICSIDILFLNQERTGYLIYFSLVGLFLWQRLRWKGLLSSMIAIPLIFGGLYFTSHKFNTRMNQVFSNISDYQKGKEITSIGLRLAFAKYSFEVIKQHPIAGVGTGSFQEVYQTLGGPRLDDGSWPTHPHNEYILLLFQLGILGLFVFCYWIFLQFYASFLLEKPEKYLLQGLVVGFVLLSFCNASLLVNPAGSFYIIFLAVFLGSRYNNGQLQLEAKCE